MPVPSALDTQLVQAAEPSAVDKFQRQKCVQARQQIEGKACHLKAIHVLRRERPGSSAAEHSVGWLRRKTALPDLQEGRFEDAEEDEEEPAETGQHHS